MIRHRSLILSENRKNLSPYGSTRSAVCDLIELGDRHRSIHRLFEPLLYCLDEKDTLADSLLRRVDAIWTLSSSPGSLIVEAISEPLDSAGDRINTGSAILITPNIADTAATTSDQGRYPLSSPPF